jgi:hypothetical protein
MPARAVLVNVVVAQLRNVAARVHRRGRSGGASRRGVTPHSSPHYENADVFVSASEHEVFASPAQQCTTTSRSSPTARPSRDLGAAGLLDAKDPCTIAAAVAV